MTPKFEDGRSAKALILKSGFSSQSGGRSSVPLVDVVEGLGEGFGLSGGDDESVVADAAELCLDLSFEEELPELVEANRSKGAVVDGAIRYCHPTLTSRRLWLSCRRDPWRSYE